MRMLMQMPLPFSLLLLMAMKILAQRQRRQQQRVSEKEVGDVVFGVKSALAIQQHDDQPIPAATVTTANNNNQINNVIVYVDDRTMKINNVAKPSNRPATQQNDTFRTGNKNEVGCLDRSSRRGGAPSHHWPSVRIMSV